MTTLRLPSRSSGLGPGVRFDVDVVTISILPVLVKRSINALRRSGDLLNATTGEVVGTVLSFSANGVTTTSGLSFPSGVMPLTWSADGHFTPVFLNGVR